MESLKEIERRVFGKGKKEKRWISAGVGKFFLSFIL